MFRSILLVGLALVSVSAHAASDAYHWLGRMNTAARTLNFQGVFVYLHENQMEAMRVAHAVNHGAVRERLYSLNGEAREVVRDGPQVWCYLPDKKMGVHEFRKVANKSFPRILPDQVSVLQPDYDIHMGKPGRIADRAAQSIVVNPKDQYRYGYRLWADTKTGLLLKADLVGANDQIIEQYMFTDISIGKPVPGKALEAHTPKANLVWYGEREKTDNDKDDIKPDTAWKVEKLPPGYRLTMDIDRYIPVRKRPVQHLVFSDGIAALSVFIEKLNPNDPPPMTGPSRMGAVHAYGTVVDGHRVTVVGEVPAVTVNMVGKSVRYIPATGEGGK